MTEEAKRIYDKNRQSLLRVDPAKLRSVRGLRPRRMIAGRSNGRITKQMIYNWEMGLCRPKLEVVPILLEALGLDSFDDIASPIDPETAKKKETKTK